MTTKLKIITVLTSVLITLVLIISAVKLSLNFRPLYYFDINYLNITKDAEMGRTEIIRNYNVLIDYLGTFYRGELKFPTLPMSQEGKIHFEDVKNIFVKLDYLMYLSLFFSIIGITYLYQKKDYLFLKYTSILLIGLPILLFIPLVIDFDSAFTLFHQIAFRNEYWLLSYETDPIINLLPQHFFMHTAFLILIIITVESLFLNFLYRYHIKKYNKKSKI